MKARCEQTITMHASNIRNTVSVRCGICGAARVGWAGRRDAWRQAHGVIHVHHYGYRTIETYSPR